MKTKITLFIFCYVVWAILDWPLDIQHALAGIAVAGLAVFITRDMFRRQLRSGTVRICLGLCCGIPLFFWESLKTNVNFILLVLNPDLPD